MGTQHDTPMAFNNRHTHHHPYGCNMNMAHNNPFGCQPHGQFNRTGAFHMHRHQQHMYAEHDPNRVTLYDAAVSIYNAYNEYGEKRQQEEKRKERAANFAKKSDAFWADVPRPPAVLHIDFAWDGHPPAQCTVNPTDSVASCLQREFKLKSVRGLKICLKAKSQKKKSLSVQHIAEKGLTFLDLGACDNTTIAVTGHVKQSLSCIAIKGSCQQACQANATQMQGSEDLCADPECPKPEKRCVKRSTRARGDRSKNASKIAELSQQPHESSSISPVCTSTNGPIEAPPAPAVPLVGIDAFKFDGVDPFKQQHSKLASAPESSEVLAAPLKEGARQEEDPFDAFFGQSPDPFTALEDSQFDQFDPFAAPDPRDVDPHNQTTFKGQQQTRNGEASELVELLGL